VLTEIQDLKAARRCRDEACSEHHLEQADAVRPGQEQVDHHHADRGPLAREVRARLVFGNQVKKLVFFQEGHGKAEGLPL
jgi:hypothetical protein